LAVSIDVHIPGVDGVTARKLIEEAHEVCPYSNATRREHRGHAHRRCETVVTRLKVQVDRRAQAGRKRQP
jgi:organic hydroperoxide reductase OsmC/OhrA